MSYRMNWRQWIAQKMQALVPQPRAKREKRPEEEKIKPIPWQVTLPSGQWIFVEAITKSEARGRAKRELHLPALPAGTRTIKVV